MKGFVLALTMATALLTPPAATAAPAATPSMTNAPVTVEYYYRIRWGSADEFKDLYRHNHLPILEAMQKQGFIQSLKMEEPYTHLAGGVRWDFRETIVYRDAAAAAGGNPAFDQAWDAAKSKLYPDAAKLSTDEARRMSLLEDHWDVIVSPAE